MTNNYTYTNGEGPGSADGSNITTVSSAASPTFTESTWKIVGNSNAKNAGPGNADGWNSQAPDYTQGAEFAVNTTGYANIGLSFDWFCTSSGVANMQVRYTTDDTQGSNIVWTNVGTDLIATSNDFYGATSGGVTEPNILLTIPANANNDANFAVEMVAVHPTSNDANYASTPSPATNYASAAGGDYNNNSGNWSFDNISITGQTLASQPPSIVSNPSNTTQTAGNTATFTAVATSNASVVWEDSPTGVAGSFVPVTGGTTTTSYNSGTGNTTTTYGVTALPSNAGYQFEASFTNSQGTTPTTAGTLTVPLSAPVITLQPSNTVFVAGQGAAFAAFAYGNPAPTVQWYVSTTATPSFTLIQGAYVNDLYRPARRRMGMRMKLSSAT